MDTFSALAVSTRRDIIELLAARGQLSATSIYNEFQISHPAISQHLKILREANLVKVEKQAQQRLYRLNPDKIEELEKWVQKMKENWEEGFKKLDELLAKEAKNV